MNEVDTLNIKIIDEKIHELKIIAQWAAIFGLGNVRDIIRTAIYKLEQTKGIINAIDSIPIRGSE